MKKPKGYKPGEIWFNFTKALCGVRFPFGDEVREFGRGWQDACNILDEAGEIRPERKAEFAGRESLIKAEYQKHIADTVRLMRAAAQTQDGSFFRRFADFIETSDYQRDPLRTWLTLVCFDVVPPRKQRRTFTCAELLRLAFKMGVLESPEKRVTGKSFTERQMRNVCKELGIKLKPAAQGRPRKSRKFKKA